MIFCESYKVFIERKAQKFLEGLSATECKKLVAKIELLTSSKSQLLDIKKLKGYKNLYRIKVDDYRIIFVLVPDKKIIIIPVIGHRKEIYDIAKRLSYR